VSSATIPHPQAINVKRPARDGGDGDGRSSTWAGLASSPVPVDRLAGGPSLLCRDEATRRRMLDMENHLRPARVTVFALLAGTLVVLGPWIGWWPLAPLAGAAVGFRLADRLGARSRRPEYHFMVAWCLAQLMIGVSIVFTGGPDSVFLPWLAIPAATLSARFNARGVIAGVTWTTLITLAVTIAVSPAEVAASPQRVLVPLTLLAGVGLFSAALMRSDVKHRAAASIDPLTGLFNRQSLALRAGELIAQARFTDTPVAVLMCDVDHFKHVNDRNGHMIGDQVLRELANTMRTTLRTFDYIYRYGGEEFVVLLPGSDEAAAVAAAERLRAAVALARPADLDMTISVGVGVCAQAGAAVELDDLLVAADRALYAAKADGRDRVCVSRATDGVAVQPPPASLAAQAAGRCELAGDPGAGEPLAATPAAAFAAARTTYLMGRRLDMAALAAQLGVSGQTLARWCGEREQLLGEVLASLSETLLAAASENHREDSGVSRILAVYRQFVGALVNAQPLQIFLRQEPQAALEILTSADGHVHPRTLAAVRRLLLEEQRAGAFTPKTDVRSLAYAMVRLTEAFLYHNTVLATEPQVERGTRVVALLLD